MAYSPDVNPLDSKLVERIESADWDKIMPMLIGFDVYVDVEGNVGFYEGNSSPFALGDYVGMFGNDLEKAIARQLKGGKVGINIDLDTEEHGARSYNARVAREICDNNGISYVMASEETTKWDAKKKKLYFKKGGKKKKFDILFNRCPSAHARLRKIVPRENWIDAPIMTPIAPTLVLANKDRTRRVLTEAGLDMPVAYVARNSKERRQAMEKVMAHIEEEHPNYEPPYILIKPVSGTGARRIRVFRDANSTPSSPIKYPCLVGERITAQGIKEPDGTHVVDTRMFYCGAHASHGMAGMAPQPIEGSTIYGGKGFKSGAYVTNPCRKGVSISLWEPEAEKLVQQHVLAAALAIDEGSRKRYGGKK